MRAEDIRSALQRHYSDRGRAVLFEVQDGVAKDRKTARAADAIAVSFWDSRGLEVEGFEIKTARSDWMREVHTPEKANAHFVRCDRWWLITPRRAGSQPPIAKAEEIPGPWGWMVVDAKGELGVYKTAPKLVPSLPFDKGYMFALIKAAARYDADEVTRQVRERLKKQETDFTASVNAAAARLAKPGMRAPADPLVDKLKAAFGPAIGWLGDQRVLDTIRAVRALDGARGDEFRRYAAKVRAAAEQLEEAASAIDASATLTESAQQLEGDDV